MPRAALDALLHRYGFKLVLQQDGSTIRGSYWGDSEAGIIGRTVYVRGDTPIHSLLHETCHLICMTEDRRSGLDRDAGGDDLEESAVCYLQIVLADHIDSVGRERLMLDMDAWGYSFRLGNTRDWFESDAEDAREFLMNHGLLNVSGDASFRLRH
ncbi:MAG: hypothetical protein OEW73_14195 [Gammaproteobacteria bacterium]|nr:hypothetical protein [Gammaproteobacteria bacterium]MDH5260392.1 hypothetical protein [Gammaproteobacteria bacterium]MDH5583889.1 hypothetical protein [Gammaproteobacteria bacterium]